MPKGVPKGIVRRPFPIHLEKFAIAYAATSNRVEAYQASGGKGSKTSAGVRAAVWLKRPDVQSRVAEILGKIEAQAVSTSVINRGWVEQNIVEVVSRAMQKEAVFDHDGKHTGEWKFDSAAALRGLELCGKTLAMFTDKSLISEELDSALQGKTPEQIEGVMKALIAEIGSSTIRRYLAETEHTLGEEKTGHDESGRAGEDAAGVPPEEAGALPPVSKAGGLPPGRILQ